MGSSHNVPAKRGRYDFWGGESDIDFYECSKNDGRDTPGHLDNGELE